MGAKPLDSTYWLWYTAAMETKINKKLPKGQKRQRRSDWQEHLPVGPILLCAVGLIVIAALILLNRTTTSVKYSPEMDVIRSRGALRIAVDSNLYGLHQNGEGLEIELGKRLGREIFNAEDCVSFVSTHRYTLMMELDDGSVDLALMSVTELDSKGYQLSKQPFYSEPCILLAPDTIYSLENLKIGVLNGSSSQQLLEKFETEVEPELLIVPSAAYYDLIIAMRARRVDAICLPLSAALTYADDDLIRQSVDIGTLHYYAVAKTNDRVILDLVDEISTEDE